MIIDDADARAEIEELTELLRNDEGFASHRHILRTHGLDPKRILLINFMESEDLDEWAKILTDDGRVLEWTRNASMSVTWTDLSANDVALQDIPTLAVARKMMARNDS